MSKLLVYIPYDFSDVSKGSSVRPHYLAREIKHQFKDNSFVISGSVTDRKKKFAEFKAIFRERGNDWALYMESSNWHLYLFDYWFMIWAKLNIKSRGVFIRDIYFLFKGDYPPKNLKMKFIYKWMFFDYLLYINFFKLFVPSREFGEMMPFTKKTPKYPLPPACEPAKSSIKKGRRLVNILYVGGLAKDTGHDLLLGAFKIARSKNPNLRLKIVCNFEKERLEGVKSEGVEIITGKDKGSLEEIFRSSDFGVIPRRRTLYHDIAMPVKLFDFMSHGLPILSTDCKASANFIKRDGLGIVTRANEEDLARGILEMADIKTRETYRLNIERSIKKSNSWSHRTDSISTVLGVRFK